MNTTNNNDKTKTQNFNKNKSILFDINIVNNILNYVVGLVFICDKIINYYQKRKAYLDNIYVILLLCLLISLFHIVIPPQYHINTAKSLQCMLLLNLIGVLYYNYGNYHKFMSQQYSPEISVKHRDQMNKKMHDDFKKSTIYIKKRTQEEAQNLSNLYILGRSIYNSIINVHFCIIMDVLICIYVISCVLKYSCQIHTDASQYNIRIISQISLYYSTVLAICWYWDISLIENIVFMNLILIVLYVSSLIITECNVLFTYNDISIYKYLPSIRIGLIQEIILYVLHSIYCIINCTNTKYIQQNLLLHKNIIQNFDLIYKNLSQITYKSLEIASLKRIKLYNLYKQSIKNSIDTFTIHNALNNHVKSFVVKHVYMNIMFISFAFSYILTIFTFPIVYFYFKLYGDKFDFIKTILIFNPMLQALYEALILKNLTLYFLPLPFIHFIVSVSLNQLYRYSFYSPYFIGSLQYPEFTYTRHENIIKNLLHLHSLSLPFNNYYQSKESCQKYIKEYLQFDINNNYEAYIFDNYINLILNTFHQINCWALLVYIVFINIFTTILLLKQDTSSLSYTKFYNEIFMKNFSDILYNETVLWNAKGSPKFIAPNASISTIKQLKVGLRFVIDPNTDLTIAYTKLMTNDYISCTFQQINLYHSISYMIHNIYVPMPKLLVPNYLEKLMSWKTMGYFVSKICSYIVVFLFIIISPLGLNGMKLNNAYNIILARNATDRLFLDIAIEHRQYNNEALQSLKFILYLEYFNIEISHSKETNIKKKYLEIRLYGNSFYTHIKLITMMILCCLIYFLPIIYITTYQYTNFNNLNWFISKNILILLAIHFMFILLFLALIKWIFTFRFNNLEFIRLQKRKNIKNRNNYMIHSTQIKIINQYFEMINNLLLAKNKQSFNTALSLLKLFVSNDCVFYFFLLCKYNNTI